MLRKTMGRWQERRRSYAAELLEEQAAEEE